MQSPKFSSPRRDYSRRRFLRSAGIAMGIPALESLTSANTRRALAGTRMPATTATGAPLRTAFLYFPNGAIQDAWWPTVDGSEITLNRTMKPLQSVKDKFQILAGLDDIAANPGRDGGGEHARANSTFLTGVRIKKTNGADFRAAVSADQIMAQQIGLQAPFRSLEMTCDVVLNVGSCDTDYACVYQHNLAWSSPTTPLTPEVNPRHMFERLFGAGTAKERARNLAIRRQQKASILDFLKSERTDLALDASARDKEKLEQYYTGVRDIEQRIATAEASRSRRSQPSIETPEGIPDDFEEYIRLMYDMLVVAFETDSTRVVTFMITGDGNNRPFPELGIDDGHHHLTHHGGREDFIEKVRQIDAWYVVQLAYFIQKMEATEDIDGNSLLHNSQIVYGSGCADGNRHSHTNLPILLAGNGGGTLKPGRFVDCSGVPLCNLYLSMMDRISSSSAPLSFGDSTGRLNDL
ncbi:MAG: DUF1552 domain-containing protein [Planctomycetales bacterium]|nr:DUF1552 domain-containing protein [Planctomycetales bacterium]